MIRHAQDSDIPFFIEVGRAAYGKFDEAGAKRWLATVIRKSEFIALRGEHCIGIAFISSLFFDPEPFCSLSFFASARPSWETFRVFRLLVAWATLHGIKTWKYGPETKVDLSPFVRRLGLVPRDVSHPRFEVDLEPWRKRLMRSSEPPSSKAA